MPDRSYEQYCPVAVALDVLGDRWTLLVVRELLLGARRYSDLQAALPGISPNLLADRLRSLEDAGLAARRELDPPAARTVYELTDAGRRARDVVGALARFGFDLLEPPEGRPVRPGMAVYGAVVPFLDPIAAADVDDHYRLVVGGRTFDVGVTAGATHRPSPDSEPDLVVECDPDVIVAARQGVVDIESAVTAGRIRVEGSRAVLRRFLTAFGLRAPTRRSRRAPQPAS